MPLHGTAAGKELSHSLLTAQAAGAPRYLRPAQLHGASCPRSAHEPACSAAHSYLAPGHSRTTAAVYPYWCMLLLWHAQIIGLGSSCSTSYGAFAAGGCASAQRFATAAAPAPEAGTDAGAACIEAHGHASASSADADAASTSSGDPEAAAGAAPQEEEGAAGGMAGPRPIPTGQLRRERGPVWNRRSDLEREIDGAADFQALQVGVGWCL